MAFVIETPEYIIPMNGMTSGVYVVEWIARSRGHAFPYNERLRHKPISPQKMVELLNLSQVPSRVHHFASRTWEEKTHFLTLLLNDKKAIPLLISGPFCIPRWIAITGCDQDEHGLRFYAYDPTKSPTRDPKLNTGNRVITQKELQCIWGMSFFGLLFPSLRFLCVEVL
jgi:hypothetical protein